MGKILHSIFLIILLGDLVYGTCPPQTSARCSQAVLDAARNLGKNPTENAYKVYCQASDEQRNCYRNNNCNEQLDAARKLSEKEKQECSNGFQALLNRQDGCRRLEQIQCLLGPVEVIQEWSYNPVPSDYELKKLCKANEDIWSCVIRTNCDVAEYREVVYNTRQQCSMKGYNGSTKLSLSGYKIIILALSVLGAFTSLRP